MISNIRIALMIQIDITTATTRLWVTSSWYLRWRWTAKNLSAARATTPKNEAKARKVAVAFKKFKVISKVRVWVFSFISMTRLVLYKGWTSKPTPRSDTAILSSNTFRALGIVNGFLRASIVTMLSVMAVKGKKALKTQFAINEASIIIIAWVTQARNNFLKKLPTWNGMLYQYAFLSSSPASHTRYFRLTLTNSKNCCF